MAKIIIKTAAVNTPGNIKVKKHRFSMKIEVDLLEQLTTITTGSLTHAYYYCMYRGLNLYNAGSKLTFTNNDVHQCTLSPPKGLYTKLIKDASHALPIYRTVNAFIRLGLNDFIEKNETVVYYNNRGWDDEINDMPADAVSIEKSQDILIVAAGRYPHPSSDKIRKSILRLPPELNAAVRKYSAGSLNQIFNYLIMHGLSLDEDIRYVKPPEADLIEDSDISASLFVTDSDLYDEVMVRTPISRNQAFVNFMSMGLADIIKNGKVETIA